MLGQRRRRWANTNPTFVQRLVLSIRAGLTRLVYWISDVSGIQLEQCHQAACYVIMLLPRSLMPFNLGASKPEYKRTTCWTLIFGAELAVFKNIEMRNHYSLICYNNNYNTWVNIVSTFCRRKYLSPPSFAAAVISGCKFIFGYLAPCGLLQAERPWSSVTYEIEGLVEFYDINMPGFRARHWSIVAYCWTTVGDGGPTVNELLALSGQSEDHSIFQHYSYTA